MFLNSFKIKLTSHDFSFFVNFNFLNIRLKCSENDLFKILRLCFKFVKKRLMLKYTQGKSINYYDLTRLNKVKIRKIEIQLIYINCFNLYVFLFFLILIY